MAAAGIGAGAAAIIAANTAAAATATAASTAAAVGAAVLRFAAQMALQYAIGALAQQLMNRGKSFDGTTSSLLGLPVNNTDPGAPRVWAIGYRVRTPMQVLWQDRKVRDVSNSIKGKSGISVRHTTFALAFLLNDRRTHKLSQMIANDGLLTFDSLNLISLRNHLLTAVESGGVVTLTASSTDDPDFALVFEVGDMVEIAGFVPAGGTPNPNGKYWEVTAVTGHTSTPSTMAIEPRSNQTVTGISATGGNAFAPAVVTRIDDALVFGGSVGIAYNPNTGVAQFSFGSINHPANEVFRVSDQVRVTNITGLSPTTLYTVTGIIGPNTIYLRSVGVTPTFGGSATNFAVIEFWSQPNIATEYFPTGFIPANHFYHGDDAQTEDATIAGIVGTGEVGGFRGQAYQVIPEMDATNFGGTIPPMTEALIDPDLSMTWGQAIIEVAGRHGLTPDHIDVSQVTSEPFLGMYLRGPTNGAQALQQLLLAKQIATQDRNGTISFFQIDNADTVAVNNGDLFSDFAATVGGKPGPKLMLGEVVEKDLPTTVGVRFQDPDSGYGENYLTFGLRHPSATGEENRAELDFKNVVLTKKDARNLAATISRRARINSRPVTFMLPASYLHVLENDLLTYTDDQGEIHLVRVVRRDIGANMLVRIEAVFERANINVSGSPVQTGAGSSVPVIYTASDLAGVVFDSPPVEDQFGLVPGVHAAVCARPGASWAGATLHMSQDNGNNWTIIGTFTQPHAHGVASSEVLTGAAAPSESLGTTAVTWDASGTIDVDFDSTGPLALSTLAESAILDGWNWFAILDHHAQVVEVFAARDVVQNTATNYTLSYLLRGLRGTWRECTQDRVVEGMTIVGVQFFYSLSGQFFPLPGLTANQDLAFKFVPPGRDLATTPTVSLTTTRRNVLPFPVRDLTKSFDAGTNEVTFEADHWTRTNLNVGSVGPYPLDEPYEAYRFTLYHQSGNGQAVFIRNISAQGSGSSTLRDPFVTFTSAEQAAAGYTPSGTETYWIDVQQIGQYGLSPSVLQEL